MAKAHEKGVFSFLRPLACSRRSGFRVEGFRVSSLSDVCPNLISDWAAYPEGSPTHLRFIQNLDRIVWSRK